MSFLDVYIGELDDSSFSWDDGEWNGNCPVKESGFFPRSREIFRLILNKIEIGELDGKQVDWGAWVARVLPSEMLKLVNDFYSDETESHEIILFIKQLDPNKRYALVASEL